MLSFRNPRLGFTLIELVIIIVILGLLSIAVVPRHVSMQKNAEEQAARRFGAALKEGCSFYISRAALKGTLPTRITFQTFVTHTRPGGALHTAEIEPGLRNLTNDPATPVWTSSDDYTTITLNFRSGATATYTINPATFEITDIYTGFDDGGGC